MLSDCLKQPFPLRMVEFLGVVQSVQTEALGKNHRGSNHGPGQRSPSRLIDPGDRSDPPGMKLLFVEKRGGSGFPEAIL